MRGVNGKESGFDLMREQRLALILQMHVSGASYRAIAAHLKKLVDVGQLDKTGAVVWRAPEEWAIEHVQVGNELKEALRNARKENKRTADEARTLASARLDSLLLAVWAPAMNGDVNAVWAALAIEQRRAGIEGTNKPVEQKRRIVFAIEDTEAAPEGARAADDETDADDASPDPASPPPSQSEAD
jgi:hypothetical protein